MAQSLDLTAVGANDDETSLLDALGYQNVFNDFTSLESEVNTIANSLTQQGYLESRLKHLNKVSDSSFVAEYFLGAHYTKARVHFDRSFDFKTLRLVSNSISDDYFEIDIQNLEQSLQTLNTEISNDGDPFSTLQLANIKKVDGVLYADLEVIKHRQRTIDTIIVKGYDKFPKAFLRRYLRIKNNDVFNLKTIKEKTETLENLQFASQIKDPEVLFTKDSTLLYIYVEKQKSNTFDGFLGFGTNPDTDKLEFDGYLNLNLINNLNYGESLRVLYKSDENEQKTFDVQTQLPYLFGSPIGVQLGLNIFKKDSSFVTTSQLAKMEYKLDPKNSVAFGVSAQASTNLLDHINVSVEDFKSTFYHLSYHHTRSQRYDVLFPINFLFNLSGGLGKRTIEHIGQSQSKLELHTFKIFNLNLRNSLYGQVSAAVLNSDTYVENELFRFGGINSIRGFEENSLTANLFGVLNTEYRYKLSNSLYVNSIIDIAYYENRLLDTKNKLVGLGFGFGVLTQAGLFKLNYSNGSSKDQPIKLSNSKVHISLSATF